MTDETTVFPTTTLIDVATMKEQYDKARDQRHINNIEEGVKAAAMLWLIENNIWPAVEGLEFYSAEVMSWTCGFTIQLPFNSRTEVEELVQLILDAGWKNVDGDDKQDKDRVGQSYGTKRPKTYLEYKFRPDKELLKEIKDRFDYEFKYVKAGWSDGMRTFSFSEWTVDFHIEFYPTDAADCQITDLGKAKVEREVQVWEVTCPEGAKEMQALMNGGK